jgi:polyhydroxyalkanoate synthesis regulator phasin
MMSKNVSEERMQILEMVEEGKINASEALELFDALERNQPGIMWD